MHIGIGAAILILGLIYFMIVSPGFRATVLIGAVGLAILIAAFIATHRQEVLNMARRPDPYEARARELALAAGVDPDSRIDRPRQRSTLFFWRKF
jgi:hypothetical protein